MNKNLWDYEFLPDKDLFKKTFKYYRQDVNHYRINDLANKLFVTADTIRKWENGENFPTDLMLLNRIANEYFDISVEDLIIPNSKFKMLNHKNLLLYNYNRLWFLIEKNISTFLGLMEHKELLLNYASFTIKIKNEIYTATNLPFDYIKNYCDEVIKEFNNDNSKKMSDKTKNKILYKLRTNIIVLDFKEMLKSFFQEQSILTHNIKFLSKFDKIIFLTLLYYYNKNICIDMCNHFKMNEFYVIQSNDFKFTRNISYDYIYLMDYLQKLDYEWFNKHLIIVKGDNND